MSSARQRGVSDTARYRRPPRWRGLLVLGSLPALYAAASPTDKYAAVEALLESHPSVLALRDTVVAAREEAAAANALPDPVFNVGLNNFPLLNPSFDQYLPTNAAIGVNQQLPNRALRRARSEARERVADGGEIGIARQLDMLRARLVRALVLRQRIAGQQAIAQERDRRYAELVEVIRAEIDAGRPVVFRLAQIDVERADVARELAALAAEAAEVDAELVDLVGSPVNVPAPHLAGMPVRSGDATDFHDVRLARARVRVADAGVDEASGEFGPDFGVGFTWQFRSEGRGGPGSTFDGDDWVSANLYFSLPVRAEKRQAPMLRAARATRSALQSQSLAAARAAEARWSSLAARVTAEERSIEILQSKLAALERQIAAMLTNYEAGLDDYSRVLDSQIARLTLRSQLLDHRAQRDLTIAEARAMLVTP
jgi:cobalt-zinc-cadmium efflux system outer membrane protein